MHRWDVIRFLSPRATPTKRKYLMKESAKLHIDNRELELDLSDLTALSKGVASHQRTVDYELCSLLVAKDIVDGFGSLEEAIASKQAEFDRLGEKLERFERAGLP